MPQVDRHPVAAHRVLDLAHDRRARRLDPERVFDFDDVVAPRFQAVHACM